jgi:hypothetical protein
MEGRLKGGGDGSSMPPPAVPPAEAARARRSTAQQQQVKVKHIVTREVSTDQANFKDVVQRLTGKDSGAARAAVVAAGADASMMSWSGGGSAPGVRSGDGAGAAVVALEDNVTGVTTTMLPSVEDMRRWWWHGP